ncbi:phospholipase [Streptacidiphilus sp. PB12-B1b]|uniref:alkaline phosphatase family protein n=1 Tax=Streptacidiphilus sp. PB12-B1b TaxID=2705012 RepID=UPI0015F7ADB4|nr:alkaline phosphatase family protein [Streptacidiphilus sp. PB12-B1b]QMU77920.1 phospholipase [Streptacidiphilus sp. PB12-B1b]
MTDLTRRRLLGTAGAAALASLALPPSLTRALAAAAADPQAAGSLADVQHVVILMQENRSFDEYFGTLPGVRGFADPDALTLSTGNSVFHQPDATHTDGYLLPFHLDTTTTSAQATPGLDHSWTTQHEAWNNGAMDQWVSAKGQMAMGYYTAEDIPFHTALAQAFTVCDNYFCSMLGPTNPNRLYMWSGTVDPGGTGGGPITDDSPAYNNPILSWTTYPERLQAAGISWRVYQEYDNYDDNALAWFKQYANAPAGSPLHQNAMVKRPAGWFEEDARNDRLPQVSWLVAPSAQCEHPNWMPAAGAEYIASKLEAIASNPEVWAKTLFILTYDENDGYFDHVPPPTPPAGTAGEFVDGVPIGAGFRVPTIMVSPWTAGGYVYSEPLDHTSLIRLLETVFGVAEPNISAWRRQTFGDMTGALNLGATVAPFPSDTQLGVAAAAASLVTAQQEVAANPAPQVPTGAQTMPTQ